MALNIAFIAVAAANASCAMTTKPAKVTTFTMATLRSLTTFHHFNVSSGIFIVT